MEKAWFYKRFFFELVKRWNVNKNYLYALYEVDRNNVAINFHGIWSNLDSLTTFIFSLSLWISKRLTLAKMWGFCSLPIPPSPGFYMSEFETKNYTWILDIVQNHFELWQVSLSEFLSAKFFNTTKPKIAQGTNSINTSKLCTTHSLKENGISNNLTNFFINSLKDQ